VIVADGLMAFLTQHDTIPLLNRLIDHFPGGEVAFNGYSRFAIWAAKHYHGTQSVADRTAWSRRGTTVLHDRF
jgi:O-methyltransferase involved in polyketide biosynthesis